MILNGNLKYITKTNWQNHRARGMRLAEHDILIAPQGDALIVACESIEKTAEVEVLNRKMSLDH
jgi:hypothetical protein